VQASAAVSVGNVRSAQRAGTKLVCIDYDVAGAAAPVAVNLQVSSDGGSTWTVPVTSAAGAVGSSFTAGSNLQITSNAGVDWNGRYSTQMRCRVGVYDAPGGFVAVVGGALPSSSSLGAVAVSTFYIGKYEVQWGEFQTVRTYAVGKGYDIGSVGAGNGNSYPVTIVTWYHALKWCNARSVMEAKTPVYTVGGLVYQTGDQVPVVNASANRHRLPSEKEWEWAARGGIQPHGYTYSGSNDINEVAWYGSNSGSLTHVVGTTPANEVGTYDMSGNVWEWCFDLYSSSNTHRVFRGGSWDYSGDFCPVGNRYGYYPISSDGCGGFRVNKLPVPCTSCTFLAGVDRRGYR
jgi:formylglycine-generating enzyme required for sulfatase activity